MSDMLDSVDFEEIVRTRAYALWESEGCPAGRDAAHWLASEEAALRELAPAPVAAAAPVMKAKAKPAAKKKAAPAKHSGVGPAPAYA